MQEILIKGGGFEVQSKSYISKVCQYVRSHRSDHEVFITQRQI